MDTRGSLHVELEVPRARERALAVLELADPLPALAACLEDLTPADLASVLHAVTAALRWGHPHPTLRWMPVDFSWRGRRVHLDLLLLPSIFEPDAWSRTFLEGILRGPRLDDKC